jgi:NAD dependent epimerase/dehydratase family enzyme
VNKPRKRRLTTKKPPKTFQKTTPDLKQCKKSPQPWTTQRRHGMNIDPLGLHDEYSPVDYIRRYTTTASRSGTRPLHVLVAGFNSFFCQHLLSHLYAHGFEVTHAATEDGTHPMCNTLVHTHEYFAENGLPDVDFVINCAGMNPWRKMGGVSQLLETKVKGNKFWADLIRKSKAKPYAYLTLSSTDIYPGGTDELFFDSWQPPQLSPYIYTPQEIFDFDKEHNVTQTQQYWRAAEESSRVYIPELDARTPEQIEEFLKLQEKYDQTDIKSGVHGAEPYHGFQQEVRNSVRYNLLTNEQVRVIPIRLATFPFCREMQMFRDYRAPFEAGRFGPVHGHDKTIVPWVWMDDACQAVIKAMASDIKGPLNVVSPTTTTLNTIMTAIPEISQNFSQPMTEEQLNGYFGTERAKLLYQQKIVVPRELALHDFKYAAPTVKDAVKIGRAKFEREIKAFGGIDKHPRFLYQPKRD